MEDSAAHPHLLASASKSRRHFAFEKQRAAFEAEERRNLGESRIRLAVVHYARNLKRQIPDDLLEFRSAKK